MALKRIEGVWIATDDLRLYHRTGRWSGHSVIQRAWQNLNTGAIEWRDLPVAYEEDEVHDSAPTSARSGDTHP